MNLRLAATLLGNILGARPRFILEVTTTHLILKQADGTILHCSKPTPGCLAPDGTIATPQQCALFIKQHRHYLAAYRYSIIMPPNSPIRTLASIATLTAGLQQPPYCITTAPTGKNIANWFCAFTGKRIAPLPWKRALVAVIIAAAAWWYTPSTRQASHNATSSCEHPIPTMTSPQHFPSVSWQTALPLLATAMALHRPKAQVGRVTLTPEKARLPLLTTSPALIPRMERMLRHCLPKHDWHATRPRYRPGYPPLYRAQLQF